MHTLVEKPSYVTCIVANTFPTDLLTFVIAAEGSVGLVFVTCQVQYVQVSKARFVSGFEHKAGQYNMAHKMHDMVLCGQAVVQFQL